MSSNETLIPLWPPPKPPASRTPWIAAAAIGLLIAAVIALLWLWLSARGDIDERTLERDTAIAERDAVNATKIANDAELETLRDEMAAAQNALDAAQSDATDAPTAEEVAEAQAAIDELNAEIERLTAENEALLDEVEAATTTTIAEAQTDEPATEQPAAERPVDEAEAATTTTTSAEAATATTAPTPAGAEPADPDEVGDQLASLYRNDVLGDLQKRCLGDFVLGNIGNDETVAILGSENPEENETLENSLRLAVDFCLIAPSAVFGN